MYESKAVQDKRQADRQMLGLTDDDFGSGDGISGVWPENLTAVRVFDAMSTQWRVGQVGATGLDYAALPAVMRLLGVPADARADAFECVQILEDEAMKVMREARNG